VAGRGQRWCLPVFEISGGEGRAVEHRTPPAIFPTPSAKLKKVDLGLGGQT
jgi:hypothetical protein